MKKWLLLAGLAFLVGCVTSASKIWPARVGVYTYDQTVEELGPPDKEARLSDGTIVAEWLTRRGYTDAHVSRYWSPYYGYPMYPLVTESRVPDFFLRLTFGPDGRLHDWRTFAR